MKATHIVLKSTNLQGTEVLYEDHDGGEVRVQVGGDAGAHLHQEVGVHAPHASDPGAERGGGQEILQWRHGRQR